MIPPKQIRTSTHQSAGYTLIELMVVVFLIALATSLVLPITVRSYSSFKVRMAANSIVHLFQQAKSRSLFESRVYLVLFPTDNKDREVLLIREDGATVAHYDLPADILIHKRNGENDWSDEIGPVAFYPDGSAEELQLALESVSGASSRIQVEPSTGQARILLSREDRP